MARPIKPGLDYFPFDTNLDRKFEILEAKHGLNGFGIIVKLLQRIYGENGYYLEFGEIDALLLGSRYGLSAEEVQLYIDTAVELGIFDSGIYQSYSVLTSHGIQLRFIKGSERRKRIDMKQEYLLLGVPEIPINVYINGVNVCNNPENVYTNTQSKVKESKEKDSKVEESKDVTAAANVFLHYEQSFGVVVSPTAMQEIDGYLADGVEPEMMVAVFDEAVAQGSMKANWQYAKGILNAKLKSGIKTLAGFRRSQADFKAAKEQAKTLPKQSKLCNYEDTNKTDYAALETEVLDCFLEGDGST